MPAGLDYVVNGGLVTPRQAQALHYAGLMVIIGGVAALLLLANDIRTTQERLGCAALCVCEDIRANQSYYPDYSLATARGEAEEPETYKEFMRQAVFRVTISGGRSGGRQKMKPCGPGSSTVPSGRCLKMTIISKPRSWPQCCPLTRPVTRVSLPWWGLRRPWRFPISRSTALLPASR